MTDVLALLDFTSLVSSSGLAAVFVLSAAQSCCVPTSSELTLGFAGVLAAEGKLSLPAVIVVAILGELVGALVAWVIGRSAGRAVVDRWGKYLLLSHRDLDRVEDWYGRHERWGVLGSRLLPVVRNFVALPAGIAEVPIVRFGVLTLVGSAVWDTAMALIGYEVGHRYQHIMKGVGDAGYVLGALVVVAVVVFVWHRYRSYRHGVAGPVRRAAPTGSDPGATVRSSSVRIVDRPVPGQPSPGTDPEPRRSAGSPPAATEAAPPSGGPRPG